MIEKLLGISVALAQDAAQTGVTEAPLEEQPNAIAGLLTTLIPLILMVAVFYFMLIRPQRKKDKKVKEMLNALKKGDRVTTIGGIYGTIMSIKDDTITLAVGQSGDKPTEMTVARWAIRGVEEVSVENEGELLN